ncbi:MAG: aspartate kinase [Deltaproteobacteria bacterium SM23_61]|nr:MAG: aspartate kinase [Deltaproteobacteria bacterium SM23_61]
MALIVQKYGGTSVGDIDRIRNVANRVAKTRKEGNDVVVVVSAMSGETDRLIRLAQQAHETPDLREYDSLISTGEQASAALLAITLQSMGIPARSFLGSQIRILTDSAFSLARIQDVETKHLRRAIKAGVIPVVTGFQGVDRAGNITTLGRGGSDTTGVAVAAALKAHVCEIYTDVDGVYTTDPNLCPEARKLSRISYDEMMEMASLGAKVLQIRSVEFAKKYNVPIHVRSSFNDRSGTWVVKEDEKMEKVLVSGVTLNKNEARVTISGVPDKPGIASKIFTPISDAQNSSADGLADMTFTVPKADIKRALRLVKKTADSLQAREVLADENIAKVSIVGAGMVSHSGVASKMFTALAGENINILMISTSEIKISCVVEAKYGELAARVLHKVFGLEKGGLKKES